MSRKKPLSRTDIVEAAIELADADGADGLSMRRLADAVDAAPMSLYTHVTDKDDLLAAAVDHVIARVDLPLEGTDWRTGATQIAESLRRHLVEHPWICDLWNNTWPGPARTRLMEDILAVFRRDGFDRRMAHHALHAFDVLVVGYAHQEATFTLGGDDQEASAQLFLTQAPIGEFPYVHEHVAEHIEPTQQEDNFSFLLTLMLDGLAAHRDG